MPKKKTGKKKTKAPKPKQEDAPDDQFDQIVGALLKVPKKKRKSSVKNREI